MSERNFPIIDQLYIKLIEELELDARQTYKNLATKLGVSRFTIATRMKRLLDSGAIKFLCITSPDVHGYKYIAYLAIDAEPRLMVDVAHKLADCKQIGQVYMCSGRFNIFASAFYRDNKDFSDLLTNEIGTIPGIQHIETMILLQEVKMFTKLLANYNDYYLSKDLVKELDDLNLELIKELERDAAQDTGQLARKLGINKSTVSRRIQQLMEKDIVRIGIRKDPTVLGTCNALIGLKCYPAKVKEVVDVVATYKQVQYVSICAGRYDIAIWAVFPELSDLRHFVMVELGSIPGLRDIETMINYNLVKFSLRL